MPSRFTPENAAARRRATWQRNGGRRSLTTAAGLAETPTPLHLATLLKQLSNGLISGKTAQALLGGLGDSPELVVGIDRASGLVTRWRLTVSHASKSKGTEGGGPFPEQSAA